MSLGKLGIISILQMKNTEIEAAKITHPRLHRTYSSRLLLHLGFLTMNLLYFHRTGLLSNKLDLGGRRGERDSDIKEGGGAEPSLESAWRWDNWDEKWQSCSPATVISA